MAFEKTLVIVALASFFGPIIYSMILVKRHSRDIRTLGDRNLVAAFKSNEQGKAAILKLVIRLSVPLFLALSTPFFDEAGKWIPAIVIMAFLCQTIFSLFSYPFKQLRTFVGSLVPLTLIITSGFMRDSNLTPEIISIFLINTLFAFLDFNVKKYIFVRSQSNQMIS